MTDLEKFIDVYKQFGIELKTFQDDGRIKINLGDGYENPTYHEKLDGYPGFYSDVEFTLEGEFVRQGFWE